MVSVFFGNLFSTLQSTIFLISKNFDISLEEIGWLYHITDIGTIGK